jgi:predicted acyltransferase
MGAAAAVLTLLGHDDPALNRLAVGAAAVDTLVGVEIEIRRHPAGRPLREGLSGLVVRAGGILAGPVPLLMRTLSQSRRSRQLASLAAISGSLLTRLGWVLAGRVSANEKPPQPARR